MKTSYTLSDIKQGKDPDNAGQQEISLPKANHSKPTMFSILFTDKMDMNENMPHHSYFAHGKLAERIGAEGLRTAYSLPEGLFEVIVVDQYGKACEAMVSSWIEKTYHRAVAFLKDDKEGRDYVTTLSNEYDEASASAYWDKVGNAEPIE